MAETIDKSLLSRFASDCDAFCGSSLEDDGTAEMEKRRGFITKLYSFLATRDQTDSQYGKTMNYILGSVVDHDVLLMDMMTYFSEKAMDEDSFSAFLDEYSGSDSTAKHGMLKTIETELLRSGEGGETSVGDVIEADGIFKSVLMDVPSSEIYVIPKMAITFRNDVSGRFATEIDAAAEYTSKLASYVSSNPDCRLFKSGYTDLDSLCFDAFGSTCLLWKVGRAPHSDLLKWLGRMSFTGSETIESICENHIGGSDSAKVLGDLTRMFYGQYAEIAQNYETRNSEFSMLSTINGVILGYDYGSLSSGSLASAAFMCLVSEKNKSNLSDSAKARLSLIEAKILDYASKSNALEGYLNGLRSFFRKDARFCGTDESYGGSGLSEGY